MEQWDALKNNFLYFRITKNGEPHKVFIPDSLLKDMRQLKVYEHGYIFGSRKGKFDQPELNREISQRCQKAGITKHITARSMRGTGITSYLKKYNPHQVAKISNHKTLDTIYRHYYKPDEDELKDIVRHNEVQPDEPSNTEIIDAYRKVSDQFKKTSFGKYVPEIERYIENLLYK